MKLELLATTGSVTIAHDSARLVHDSNAYTIEILDADREFLIGTIAHDDEMNALVGRVMADTMRRRVADGTYICILTQLEVMGLRGSLVERIEALPGNAAAEKPRSPRG